MAKGGTRRPRQDENAHRLEVDAMEIEAAKRSKPSPPEVSGKGKSRKSSRRRAKDKKNSNKGEGMASTALHPINVNVTVSPPTPAPITALQKRKTALDINQDNASQSNAGPSEGESSPSSMDSPKEQNQPVIWSNPAFCSERGLQQPLAATSSTQTTSVLKKVQLAGEPEPLEEVNVGSSLEDLKQKTPSLGKGKHTVHFAEEQVVEENAGTVEDDEAEEIEKEIALLSKRLAELRAKREARYLSQQRAKRALSCPPTPLSSKENDKTPTEARSRKGWMVSAKFLQFQSKTPAGDKSGGDVIAALPHRRSLGLDQKESGWLTTSSKKAETTPRTGCSKVTEKPARILKKTEQRESLDECVIDQMRNLSLGTPNNSSGSSRKPLSSIKSFDWSKSLRCSGAIERSADKKLAFDEAAKKKHLGDGKPSLEAQLLVSLKETKAAGSKQSPAVTRRVRNVASRYTEAPPVQLSSRKRSLDEPSPLHAQQAAATAAARKRASLEQGSSSSALKTPTKLVRVSKDGLEQERKTLPKIVAVQRGHSPRDSGCIKRPHTAKRTNFFSTGGQWDDSSAASAAAAADWA